MKLCKDCRWYKRNFALGDLCAAPQNLVTPSPTQFGLGFGVA